jgi:hypothetical protein
MKPSLLYPIGVPVDVCQLFEHLAFKVRNAGYSRYSADAILHQIRWTYQIERGHRDFKCNDHWTATLSRWFMNKHTHMSGFFELRELRSTRLYETEIRT